MENKKLPKQYKGYDVEILMKKCEDGINLTEKEEAVFWEIIQKYCKKELEQTFGKKGMACLSTINPKIEGTSELNKALPKLYNGHDVDAMFQRLLSGKELDEEEGAILNDVVQRYYHDRPKHEESLKIEGIEIRPSKMMMRPTLKLPAKKEGKSRFNEDLPQYYNGHDIDSILEKLFGDRNLSPDESKILDDVIWDYYEREKERVDKGGQKGVMRTLRVNGVEIHLSGAMFNPYLEQCLIYPKEIR